MLTHKLNLLQSSPFQGGFQIGFAGAFDNNCRKLPRLDRQFHAKLDVGLLGSDLPDGGGNHLNYPFDRIGHRLKLLGIKPDIFTSGLRYFDFDDCAIEKLNRNGVTKKASSPSLTRNKGFYSAALQELIKPLSHQTRRRLKIGVVNLDRGIDSITPSGPPLLKLLKTTATIWATAVSCKSSPN